MNAINLIQPATQAALCDRLNAELAEHAPFYAQHLTAIPAQPSGHGANVLNIEQLLQQDTYFSLIDEFARDYAAQSDNNEKLRERRGTVHGVDTKALHSMWSQWFFGLLVPPLMYWSFASHLKANWSPELVWLRPHDSGRPERFFIEISQPVYMHAPLNLTTTFSQGSLCQKLKSPIKQIESLLTDLLAPMVDRLASLSPVAAKLHWSHAGYIIHWYLGQLSLSDDEQHFCRQQLFNSPNLGTIPHPLWRTIKLESQEPTPRIACCLRHQLPATTKCGDCPLHYRGKTPQAGKKIAK